MTEVTVKSKITGRVKTGLYSARELLEAYEDDLVCSLVACDCPLYPETWEPDCKCADEWEEYEIRFSDEEKGV
ncbi:hypothetical protein Goe25_01250 [Bacillus phage vB_BsuM-Goe25]|nr:hypothetical protein Goe25_01250 [Bacillus phage vB_BsuM-Goe25]